MQFSVMDMHRANSRIEAAYLRWCAAQERKSAILGFLLGILVSVFVVVAFTGAGG